MARQLRVEYDGAWYHVFNRGAGRRRIFIDNYDYNLFFELLSEILDTWNVQTHAFSLMGNHYHLAIHTPNSNLSRALRHLSGVYTQRFNRRHKTDGPLFKGRFRARVVEKENYLLELVRYIHLNPVHAGICKSPSAHRRTSHKDYMQKKKRFSWLFIDEILSYFGRQRKSASLKFDMFVKEKLKDKDNDILSFKKMPSIFGSTGFKEWIENNFISKNKRSDQIPEIRNLKRKPVTFDDILKCIVSFYQIDRSEVLIGVSGKKNDARTMAMYFMKKLTGANHSEIAKTMGGVKHAAVAQNIYRFHKKVKEDEGLAELCENMVSSILLNVKT